MANHSSFTMPSLFACQQVSIESSFGPPFAMIKWGTPLLHPEFEVCWHVPKKGKFLNSYLIHVAKVANTEHLASHLH